MTDFVYDNTGLPTGKEDAHALVGPANKSLVAAEWNLVMQALDDLRSAILAGTYHAVEVSTGQYRIGSRVLARLSAAIPSSGTADVGDIAYITTPVAGGNVGWICVTAGTPGTWKEFGIISL